MVVSHAVQKVSWEELVPHTALQQGSTLIADELHTFAMHWANIQEFWEVSICLATLLSDPYNALLYTI